MKKEKRTKHIGRQLIGNIKELANAPVPREPVNSFEQRKDARFKAGVAMMLFGFVLMPVIMIVNPALGLIGFLVGMPVFLLGLVMALFSFAIWRRVRKESQE